MRIVLILLMSALAASAFGQGTLDFANRSSTRLTTNDFQGNVGFTTGVNAYRIGFYMAPLGTTDEAAFTLVLPVATNSTGGVFDGLFDGNGLLAFQIPGNTGQPIAFQVRAWSLFAGATVEQAQLYNGPETVYYGRSAIGFVTPEVGSGPPAPLFGTFGGGVSGFTLTPIIPEPATWALVVLGAGALWFATCARRRKSSPSRTAE